MGKKKQQLDVAISSLSSDKILIKKQKTQGVSIRTKQFECLEIERIDCFILSPPHTVYNKSVRILILSFENDVKATLKPFFFANLHSQMRN